MAKKKRRKSTLMPVLITVLVLSVVTGIIVVIGMFSGNNNKKQSMTTTGQNDRGTNANISTETEQEWSVSVNLYNCTMYVGTVFNVTASVFPEGGSVSWLSSNPEALSIDQTGKAVVIGKGITTITASMGTVSDTVIVECVGEDGRGALGFPVYESMQAPSMPENAENPVPEMPTEADGKETLPQNPSKPVALETVPQIQQTAGATQVPTQAATQKATQSPTQGNNTYTQPAAAAVLSDIDSTQMGAYLTQFGFSLHSDGTYVYENNKVCYGEVVLDREKTHLYIIKEQDNFNLAAVSVIAKLLPESYENVWKTALKAQTDMSMNVDGRTVRIVVPQSGGHKQIVIFN